MRLRLISLLIATISAGAPLGRQAPAPPAFEVASIREHAGPLRTMDTITISGTLVRLQGYTLGMLVREAYHLNRYQLSLAGLRGAQRDWAQGVYYEIEARAPGGSVVTRDQARAMLQTLLARRFQLSVRHENKTVAVYILAPAKRGPRIASDRTATTCAGRMSVAPGGQSYAFTGCGIGELAAILQDQVVDRPVLDRTSMTGVYDYTLICAPLFMSRRHPDAGGLSPFAALQQQLGLQLEPQRAAMDTVVVVRAAPPTAN
ncbi:MAG: TIGR03435 family protein [Terriglobales bacterium]